MLHFYRRWSQYLLTSKVSLCNILEHLNFPEDSLPSKCITLPKCNWSQGTEKVAHKTQSVEVGTAYGHEIVFWSLK